MREHADKKPRRWDVWIGLTLVAGVLAIYGQTLAFEFVGFDDDLFVFQNPIVKQGLSWEGLALAFSRSNVWVVTGEPPHPLTWLSHMLDVELFGLVAGGHHAMSVGLHALSTALLFAALRALTGATWRSAAAAALWAWHPLRVESVAWVSERKDVLSGVFAMLTLLCYARYARSGSRAAWWGTSLSFALGLMSKPTLVPLPFALLLLDVWPLARQRSFARLVLEKTPLFALSALSCLITLSNYHGLLEAISPGHRAANAAVAIARYLGHIVWPRNLAPLYPHPYLPAQGGVPLGAVTIAASAALGIGITLAVLHARRQPYLAVGWLWFLGMFATTIGIVHVGNQALADRYTYLPMIGLSVALVWGTAEVFARVRVPAVRRLLFAAAACVLAGYGVAAFAQTPIWRDSETLYRHTLAVSPRSTAMQFNLANWLRAHNAFDEAVEHYRAGLEIDNVGNAMVHFDFGRALHAQGRTAEAIEQYRAAAESDPPDSRARYQLGISYEMEGRLAEAIEQYRRAAEIDPSNPKPRERLASAIARQATLEDR